MLLSLWLILLCSWGICHWGAFNVQYLHCFFLIFFLGYCIYLVIDVIQSQLCKSITDSSFGRKYSSSISLGVLSQVASITLWEPCIIVSFLKNICMKFKKIFILICQLWRKLSSEIETDCNIFLFIQQLILCFTGAFFKRLKKKSYVDWIILKLKIQVNCLNRVELIRFFI